MLFDGTERVLDAFVSKILPIKIERTGFSDLPTRDSSFDYCNLKILTPKKCFKDYQ